jgi:8-oxo-dGTP pyrophosphatase MutT (NUDIX family)
MADEPILCYAGDGRPIAVPRARVRFRPCVYGIAFSDDRSQVLLTRDRRSNVWELPGGAVEIGETADAAIIREYKEEVGLDITLGPGVYFADTFYYPGDDAPGEGWHNFQLFYIVHTRGPLDPHYEENPAAGRGNHGAGWAPVEELEGVDMLSTHYDAIQRAMHWLEATEGPAATDDADDDD